MSLTLVRAERPKAKCSHASSMLGSNKGKRGLFHEHFLFSLTLWQEAARQGPPVQGAALHLILSLRLDPLRRLKSNPSAYRSIRSVWRSDGSSASVRIVGLCTWLVRVKSFGAKKPSLELFSRSAVARAYAIRSQLTYLPRLRYSLY